MSTSTKDPISTQSKKKIKIKICKILLRPVATYEGEFWTLNKDIAQQLAAFERKV